MLTLLDLIPIVYVKSNNANIIKVLIFSMFYVLYTGL
jgi:hypothetical protein